MVHPSVRSSPRPGWHDEGGCGWVVDDAVAPTLAAATNAHMAIGGADDPVWRPERVSGTAARLQTVDGVGHLLEVPGDWRASHRVQADVLAHVEQRVRALVR